MILLGSLEPEAPGTNLVAGAIGANLMTRAAKGSYLLEIKDMLKPE